MVRYKDYVITADKNCYIIGKMKERKNKETGENECFLYYRIKVNLDRGAPPEELGFERK